MGELVIYGGKESRLKKAVSKEGDAG